MSAFGAGNLGANATTLSVMGGNLFKLAALYLGDATQWIRIAQANGFCDPNIAGLMVLKIPAFDPTAGGGIASQ